MDDVDDSNPPLVDTYKHLFDDGHPHRRHRLVDAAADDHDQWQCDLPVINLALLEQGSASSELCRADMVRAASEWGFFQVTNHGVPAPLLDRLHEEQVRIFRRPFRRKAGEPLLGFSPNSYRWGTPTATCLEQLSWSEAYHIPMMITPPAVDPVDETRLVIEEVSTAMSRLAQQLASILLDELQLHDEEEDARGRTASPETTMTAGCTRSTCFLRLNRYPPCGDGGGDVFGLCPHTDSDFLTILRQDHVGGLQLLKDGRWLTVNPNPGALIVNVGDLLQAWSNDVYRSVEHRVVASATRERFSIAFFLCPSYDTVIRPLRQPAKYRSFTFGEYRRKIREDVRLTGRKIGLQPFRRHLPSSHNDVRLQSTPN